MGHLILFTAISWSGVHMSETFDLNNDCALFSHCILQVLIKQSWFVRHWCKNLKVVQCREFRNRLDRPAESETTARELRKCEFWKEYRWKNMGKVVVRAKKSVWDVEAMKAKKRWNGWTFPKQSLSVRGWNTCVGMTNEVFFKQICNLGTLALNCVVE